MREFYNKMENYIWIALCLICLISGIFVSPTIGLIFIVLIGVHFYISFSTEIDKRFGELDRFGASVTSTLVHLIMYIGILSGLTAFVDKKEIRTSKSYEVKFLENEKIVINTGDNLEIIDNARLYWECTAKNCKNIVITIIEEKPVSNVFSSDLFYKTNIEYSVN